ncbi:MAG: 50S ribosomal protein L6 [bacterium]
MSRIGDRKLTLPEGVTVTIEKNVVIVKGPKGELKLNHSDLIKVEVVDNMLTTTKTKDIKQANVMQGTTNSLISNMIEGVSKGYEKGIEAVGVGYRFNVQGSNITVSAGYSHPVVVVVPEGLSVEQVNNTEITIKGIDKQQVTEFAANIRKIRKPEPYKGKGLRYKGEKVRRKEGKKAA